MFETLHCLFQHTEVARAKHDVDVRITFPDLRGDAVLLRHTTDNRYNHVTVTLFKFLHLSDVTVNFLLGCFADTAGVEHHDVGVFHRVARVVAKAFQHARDFFRVVYVHLTTVCMNEVIHFSSKSLSRVFSALKGNIRRTFLHAW